LAIELLFVCILLLLLALSCGALLWDRQRLHAAAQRAKAAVARAESSAKELDGQRRFLERLLDAAPDPIFAKNHELRYIYTNEANCRLTGQPREVILGKTDYEFTPPLKEQVDIFVRRDNMVLETGREDINEEPFTGMDGVLRTVSTKKSLYVDSMGRPCIVGIVRDVTEQRRAEEALKRIQAAYLAEAQKLSATGSFGWNVSTGEIFWSDESYRIFGYDPATKPSIEAIMQRVHPEDAPLVKEATRLAETEGTDFDLEHRLLMPDGTVKAVHVKVRGSNDEQFVGAVMDVTARTEAYAALEQSERRYRLLFQNMPLALLQLDMPPDSTERLLALTDPGAFLDEHPQFLHDLLASMRIKAVNQRAVEMFGARDAEELLSAKGLDVWKVSPGSFRRGVLASFRGHATFEEETKIATLDGRVIDVLFKTTRFDPFSDGFRHFVHSFWDITEFKRSQEKLQQLQAEFARAARISVLGQLTASIAHEVNQPLASLAADGAAGLNFLDRPEPNVAEASAALRVIVANAHRAGEIIARIRDIAAGKAPQHALLSLHDVIDETLLFLRHELQMQHVAVSLDLASGLPLVLGDRTQLQQVLVNLAFNAVEAMTQVDETRRVLAVRTVTTNPDKVTCMFEDSGPGIAPEHLAHLFDSYFTTKDGGMGIGLAISSSIIRAHGGDLRAENALPRGGARFSFTLPVARAAG
jgi:PAS domain S-box-containing protein